MQKYNVPFIVIDGQDGSGKGTQITLLKERCARDVRQVVFTREPGGVQLSESLREVIKSPDGMSADALTQFLMFWASRNEWVKKLVAPSLARGIPVFSDRGDSSTFAYQVFANEAPHLEAEFWRMRNLVFGEQQPTMYIIVDVPPEEARRRALGDAEHTSAFDIAPLSFYQKVREGFRRFGEQYIFNTCQFVDGTRSPQEIHEEIYTLVSKECGW